MGEEQTVNPNDCPPARAADQVVVRPMGVRDAEQASLFVEVLRNEVADLRIRLGEAERKWEQRQKRSCHDLETPEGLLRLHEQLDQAKALLGSLRLARSL
jgi:hypothetical protein